MALHHDAISWNMLIGGYAEQGCGAEAYGLFLQMQQDGFIPDEVTCVTILNPRARVGALEWVKEVHIYAVKAGLIRSSLRVGNSLIHMYAKSGSIEDAQRVFDNMMNRDVITWNIMIGGLADCCRGKEAFSLFIQMPKEGFKANVVTYVSILNPACASKEALPWVKEVKNHALKALLDSDLRVGSALLDMYAKSGSIEDARTVFDRMVSCDVITWNVMIGGLAEQGLRHEAFSLFLKIKQEGFTPNAITYASLLNSNTGVRPLRRGTAATTASTRTAMRTILEARRAGVEPRTRPRTLCDQLTILSSSHHTGQSSGRVGISCQTFV